jgi:hypothetical protein
MCQKKTFSFSLLIPVLAFTLLLLPFFLTTPVRAQSPDQDVDNGTCFTCHEDLYFMHDTGNWFCIRESPMACVSCHGGDPTATTQKTAHYDRSAHPVINADISVCRECHTEDCFDCVTKFSQVAGIKDVKLAQPIAVTHASDQTLSLPAADKQEPVNWLLLFDILAVIVVISLTLTFYAVRKMRQS